MSGIPFGLVGAAADELRNLFRDARSQIEDGVPEWVNSGTPQSTNGKIAQAAARQTCRRFAADPSSFGAVDQARLPDLCGPYLGQGTPDYLPVEPFAGGQCEIRYRVTIAGTGYFPPPNEDNSFPISVTYPGPGDQSPGVLGPVTGVFKGRGTAVDLCPGSSAFGLGVIGADGSHTFSCFPTDEWRVEGLRIVSVVPLNQLPDNCGDLPPTVQPPFRPGGPIPPEPVPFPDGPDVDIDIRPRPDGGWEICVEGVCVYIDPFGDDGGGGGGGGGGGIPEPGDRGNPGGAQDSGDGPPEGEAPPGQVLTGVLVDAIFINDFVNRTEIPDSETVYRGVCYVLMGGEPGLDLQPEGSTVIFPQFFEAPENSTKWKVIPNVGYRLSVTPYYKEVENEE